MQEEDDSKEKLIEITASNDYAFKKLFGSEENIDISIDFIVSITGINRDEFENVKIVDSEITPRYLAEKSGRLDIKIYLNNGKKINIEMQNLYFDYFPARSIFYVCHIFIENFERGQEYSTLTKCIVINVLNSAFKQSDKFHSIYKLMEVESHKILSDLIEIHFLDLTKIEEANLTRAEKWGLFIRTGSNELRERLAKGDEIMMRANTVLSNISANKEERERYLAAFRYESDQASMIGETERKSRMEGIREGVQQGMQRGRQEGRQEGIKQGAYEANLAIALKMKKENCDTSFIARVTGLSEKEINNL